MLKCNRFSTTYLCHKTFLNISTWHIQPLKFYVCRFYAHYTLQFPLNCLSFWFGMLFYYLFTAVADYTLAVIVHVMWKTIYGSIVNVVAICTTMFGVFWHWKLHEKFDNNANANAKILQLLCTFFIPSKKKKV